MFYLVCFVRGLIYVEILPVLFFCVETNGGVPVVRWGTKDPSR